MTYSIGTQNPDGDEVLALYESVGWGAYTRDPMRLVEAIKGSYLVVTARSENGTLVGLARTISDGHTIAYIQDVLVSPAFQRRGVGSSLLAYVIRKCEHIRQLVLVTDAEPVQRAFYESQGFVEAHDARPDELRAFVRIN
jgi:GNAT superfamily N-acetyltransferase